ncbi:hypothetical protein C8Q73DRAFT_410156 [Cubamyces lactineus]|nr:hypothetical protein C8Q73DRAFT_410156 [Cubamyces lactineus]
MNISSARLRRTCRTILFKRTLGGVAGRAVSSFELQLPPPTAHAYHAYSEALIRSTGTIRSLVKTRALSFGSARGSHELAAAEAGTSVISRREPGSLRCSQATVQATAAALWSCDPCLPFRTLTLGPLVRLSIPRTSHGSGDAGTLSPCGAFNSRSLGNTEDSDILQDIQRVRSGTRTMRHHSESSVYRARYRLLCFCRSRDPFMITLARQLPALRSSSSMLFLASRYADTDYGRLYPCNSSKTLQGTQYASHPALPCPTTRYLDSGYRGLVQCSVSHPTLTSPAWTSVFFSILQATCCIFSARHLGKHHEPSECDGSVGSATSLTMLVVGRHLELACSRSTSAVASGRGVVVTLAAAAASPWFAFLTFVAGLGQRRRMPTEEAGACKLYGTCLRCALSQAFRVPQSELKLEYADDRYCRVSS